MGKPGLYDFTRRVTIEFTVSDMPFNGNDREDARYAAAAHVLSYGDLVDLVSRGKADVRIVDQTLISAGIYVGPRDDKP